MKFNTPKDEREQNNYKQASQFVMMFSPSIASILMVVLAAKHEMVAFFSVTGLFVTQQLLWIIVTLFLDKKRYDSYSIIMFSIFLFILILSTALILFTYSSWFVLGFIIALPFAILGGRRLNQLN